MSNEFIIKINKDKNGKEITLDDIPLEAAEALNIFIQNLSQFAKSHSNSSDYKFMIRNGSLETGLICPEVNTEEYSIEDIIDGKCENNDLVKPFRNIQDTIKANGLDYSIIYRLENESIDLTSKFKGTRFPVKKELPKQVFSKIIFIEGKLFEAGGKNPNIHIEAEDKEYTVTCTIEQAKLLNRLLYEKVHVAALEKTKGDKLTFLLLDFYYKGELFTEYKDFIKSLYKLQILEGFDFLHDKIIKTYNLNENQLLKIGRLFNYNECNRGYLRTILMSLKPIKEDFKNEKLLTMYDDLAAILRKGSTNNSI